MIGVIGLGGAGGNIAEEAQRVGFLSGVINFSQKDLDAVDVRYKLRLSGSEGVGKNRDEAITLFQDQWETALKFIRDHFSNVNLIMFAFSSSGGSGSGIGPLLVDIVSNMMPDKVVSSIVVLPDKSEASVSQANCLKTFDELSRLNVSIFPLDNQQVKASYFAKNKIFEATNHKAIELLRKVSAYVSDISSKNGNFDETDFLTVLKTPGIAIMTELEIATINQTQLSSKWVAERANESFIGSVFVPVEYEKVTRAAVIFDGQEALMEYIDHQMIFSTFKNSMPVDLFEGNYHENNGRLLFILTGLGWCYKRLQDIEESININNDKFEAVMAAPVQYETKAGDFLSKLRKQPEKKQSVMEILNKYNKRS